MSEMEDKLNSVLNNPQLMQQIMTMAQALNTQAPPKQEQVKESAPAPSPSPLPEIDLATLQKLSGLAGQGSIDREQQALLKALGPYLSRERISKLERAMRAAKMARVASSVLGPGGLPFLSGR